MLPRSVERIEAELTPDELVSLREWLRRRGIPARDWPEHIEARAWVDLAIGRAVDEALQNGRARSFTAAMKIVCPRFGFRGDSVRRQWERTRSV